MMQKALKNIEYGVHIYGQPVNSLRFADGIDQKSRNSSKNSQIKLTEVANGMASR